MPWRARRIKTAQPASSLLMWLIMHFRSRNVILAMRHISKVENMMLIGKISQTQLVILDLTKMCPKRSLFYLGVVKTINALLG